MNVVRAAIECDITYWNRFNNYQTALDYATDIIAGSSGMQNKILIERKKFLYLFYYLFFLFPPQLLLQEISMLNYEWTHLYAVQLLFLMEPTPTRLSIPYSQDGMPTPMEPSLVTSLIF